MNARDTGSLNGRARAEKATETTGAVSVPVRVCAGILGTGLIATGAVAVFVTSNSAGAAALVAAGTVIGALAMFANRIQSVEGGGVKFQLEAVAASKLKDAQRAEREGRPELAAALRDEAQVLIAAAQPIASQYESLRLREASSWERTIKLEQVMQQAREMAPGFTDPRLVEQLFYSGTDGNRITALALMQANPTFASEQAVIDAIERPRSSFEQYHALRVAEEIATQQSKSTNTQQLRATIDRELRNSRLGSPSSDRSKLASRILSIISTSNDAQ